LDRLRSDPNLEALRLPLEGKSYAEEIGALLIYR